MYPAVVRTVRFFSVLIAVCTVTSAFATTVVASPVRVRARFVPVATVRAGAPRGPALTFDPTLFHPGASVSVFEWHNKWGGMSVSMSLSGLENSAVVDAQVHLGPCGTSAASVGPRLQDGPSRAHYAANEVWLNFTSTTRGQARVLVQKYWGPVPGQTANSIAFYRAGSSALAACVAVRFRSP